MGGGGKLHVLCENVAVVRQRDQYYPKTSTLIMVTCHGDAVDSKIHGSYKADPRSSDLLSNQAVKVWNFFLMLQSYCLSLIILKDGDSTYHSVSQSFSSFCVSYSLMLLVQCQLTIGKCNYFASKILKYSQDSLILENTCSILLLSHSRFILKFQQVLIFAKFSCEEYYPRDFTRSLN